MNRDGHWTMLLLKRIEENDPSAGYYWRRWARHGDRWLFPYGPPIPFDEPQAAKPHETTTPLPPHP